ncbi:BTAD domain-containing putative transcriptional regulator [Nonomuraea sp. bgisy101]|uniref:BTAD domain-containing putative transcriptional regulator n=1 Tax=Nonomuraea sp. bgisy101 TaxID=3413784 RepID=UPI003D702F4A
MRIHLFGGVGAVTDDGRPVDIGSGRSQAVLAALAMTPGTPVPVSRLVELVWGDAPPRTAEKTLQWHISRLRKGLGPAVIVRAGAAYRLDVRADAVDIARFQRYLREGDVSAALAEWTAPPLAGVDAPGLAATLDGLTEQWLSAVEVDLECRIESDPQAAVGPLTELARRHPFREGLWALLMTALYRVGRQGDALEAFRQARHNLVEQLGVEPGPRLRALESQILGHDDRLGERREAAQGPARPPSGTENVASIDDSTVGNLPHRSGRLIGRDEDLRVIDDMVAASPLVTLVGPGGMGKTRLALAAARIAAGNRGWGGWLIELATIRSSSEVPRAVADALGVTQRAGQSLTQSVMTVLRSRPAVLLIDNCEHVIEGAAELAHAIVTGTQARVLATSRERLGVDDELVLVVGPLDRPAGAELFHARALAADRTYDRRLYRDEVDDICRRLDGIPLAIELAAARARSHRPADLVARLDDRLRVTGERRTGVPRHRTLRAAMRWSYDLLAPAEQALFQRLSVFNGSFDLGAAEAVTDEASTLLDVDGILGVLVERSMVDVESGPFGRRFRLLETMRQFAAEQLRDHGQTDPVAERHARWCLRQVGVIGGLLRGPREIEGVVRLAELWPNLRASVAWACRTGQPRLADALVRPVVTEITLRGLQEIGDWAERLLAVTSQGDEDLVAFWLVWVAERYTQSGNPDGYDDVVSRCGEPDLPLSRYARAYVSGDGEALRRCLPTATSELRDQGEEYLAVFLEMTSAGTLLGIGRFDEVDASVSALADFYRAQGPPTLLHWALQTLGYSASFQGRRDQAERYFDDAADVDLPEGALSANKAIEARTAFRRGHRAQAFRLLRSYIDELIETGNVIAAGVVSIEFITMMAAIDRLPEAAYMIEYLEGINDFGALATRTLVAEAVHKVAARSDTARAGASGNRLDDRQALAYMRDVLGRLA